MTTHDLAVMQDFGELHQAALKRQGAKEALEKIRKALLGQVDEMLKEIELTPETCGAFPEGFFEKGGAA